MGVDKVVDPDALVHKEQPQGNLVEIHQMDDQEDLNDVQAGISGKHISCRERNGDHAHGIKQERDDGLPAAAQGEVAGIVQSGNPEGQAADPEQGGSHGTDFVTGVVDVREYRSQEKQYNSQQHRDQECDRDQLPVSIHGLVCFS